MATPIGLARTKKPFYRLFLLRKNKTVKNTSKYALNKNK
jgi:hypothetical protein